LILLYFLAAVKQKLQNIIIFFIFFSSEESLSHSIFFRLLYSRRYQDIVSTSTEPLQSFAGKGLAVIEKINRR
jgi:hypothetical protein